MSTGKLNRRFVCAACLGGMVLATGWPAARAAGKRTTVTATEALELLRAGNSEYTVDHTPPQSGIGRERRMQIAREQTPFAVLVSCSDSRVPPELLFGRGLGELFIVRNAGNTMDNVAQGSVEYAVAELGVPLIVVLGHERCGAVAAAVSVVERNTTFPGSIGTMIEPIIPAVLKAKAQLGGKAVDDPEALLDASVQENVRRVVRRLRTSEALLLEPVRTGKLKVVGARYDLDDGKVDFFDT